MNPASNFPSQVNASQNRPNTRLQNNMSLRREDQTIQSLKPQTPNQSTATQNSLSNQQAYTALRSTLSTPNISPQKPISLPSSNVPSTPQIGNQSPKVYKPNQVNQPPTQTQHNQHQTSNSINTINEMEMQDVVSSEKYSLLNSQIALIRQEMQKIQETYEKEISAKSSEVSVLRENLKSAAEDIANMKQQLLERDRKEEEYRKEFDKLKYQVASQEHELLEKQMEKATNSISTSAKPKSIRLPHSTLSSNSFTTFPNKRSDQSQDPLNPKKRDPPTSVTDDLNSPAKKQKLEKEVEVLRTNNNLLKQRLLEVKRALNGESESTSSMQDVDSSPGISLREEIVQILRQEIKEAKNTLGSQPTSSPEDTNKFKEQMASLQKSLDVEKQKSSAMERQIAALANEKREEMERNKSLTKNLDEQRANILTLFNKNVQLEQDLEKLSTVSRLLKEKEDQVKQLEQKLKTVETESTNLHKQMESLSTEKQQAEQTIVLLLHHVQTLGVDLPFDITSTQATPPSTSVQKSSPPLTKPNTSPEHH